MAAMSAYPIDFTNTLITYDFTTGPDKWLGGTNACVQLSSNVWGMIAGDADYVRLARETYAGEAETIVTKTAVTAHAAHLRPVDEVQDEMEAKARAAMLNLDAYEPWVVGSPYTVEMKLNNATHVEVAAGLPGVEKTGPLSVRFTETDPVKAYRMIRILYRFLRM